ncbi:hypothetical protein ACSCBZ_24825 [Streptomyces niveiscabiei]|uniref:hypothetical protein n=1 Tax=Streptomyces niveiscabiei TaxID=164115 RepID=UPI0006EB34D8|nr:hypothetical protein [Streptomyces niveiscabiei]
MSDPVYLPMDRDEVISYLAPSWPPRPDTAYLTLPEGTVTDGAAIVYPTAGRPGTCWWVVDSTIPTQAAGVPDEALAELLPGSVLGVVPGDLADTPPPS